MLVIPNNNGILASILESKVNTFLVPKPTLDGEFDFIFKSKSQREVDLKSKCYGSKGFTKN